MWQLELMQQNGGDDTQILGQLCADDDGSVHSQLAVSSLDDSQRNLSETNTLPEDQDEQLEMSLRSGGSTLSELYPAMIDKIGRAQQRQHVSEVADVVLRRYRKWRLMSNRSGLNNSLNVTVRHAAKNHRRTTTKESTHKSMDVRDRTNHASWQRSPMREPREKPILVMNLSCIESPKPKRIPLNETFTVREQLGSFSLSPSRSSDMTLRSKRLSLSASFPPESNDVCGSPMRQSPLKTKLISLSRSPQTFSRSPKFSCVLGSPRKPENSVLLASPLRKPLVPQRMLHPDSRLRSPQPPTPKSRRHLSFNAYLQSGQITYSQKDLDEDFARHYHKFVCQNKSFNGPSCRLCSRSCEASRQHSSTLVALALSPQRLVLRKRHRDPVWENQSLAKRWHPYSPGSKRHSNEMLRRRLCTPDAEASNWSMLNTYSGWAEPSGLGSPWKTDMAASYFERKW
ncbi:uncharacterized protein si:dkeyp-117h8.4 isoform X2 [Dunckerocampus dactyliophorus]|uniref:uncharacterized protein si:dkeyp-117h8.4 isoform X2 n=1 Tax=Dunckerocampus dactyliophorus TaxID=161453 RepID=UPI002404C282|nr:uncharacterized protein si:dkeyp-117h8.4 isoform X2 [Dunckerocampus dactyliophorus]